MLIYNKYPRKTFSLFRTNNIYSLLMRLSFSSLSNNSRLFKEEINMLYDSKCNLCMMEVNFLAKKDIHGKIKFTDIEDIKYDATNKMNGNIDYATAMSSIHAIKSNGEIIYGVQVFYELYNVIGYGWLYSFIKLPFIKTICEYVYSYWAKYRTDLTRGKSLDKLIQQRNELLKSKLQVNNNSNCNEQSCQAMKNLQ